MKKTNKRIFAVCLAVMLLTAVLVLPASAADRTAQGMIGNARCNASVTAGKSSGTATTTCSKTAHLTVRVHYTYAIEFKKIKTTEDNFENHSTEVSAAALPERGDTGVFTMKAEAHHSAYVTGFSNGWEANTAHVINP